MWTTKNIDIMQLENQFIIAREWGEQWGEKEKLTDGYWLYLGKHKSSPGLLIMQGVYRH